jgi:hypothetical protein
LSVIPAAQFEWFFFGNCGVGREGLAGNQEVFEWATVVPSSAFGTFSRREKGLIWEIPAA